MREVQEEESGVKLTTPYEHLLPPLSGTEFDALKVSIKREGVREPLLIDELGAILDGHHRFKIAPDAPTKTISGLSEAQKKAFVIASNLQRRNLSPDQKAELRKKQIEIAKALKEGGEAQHQIATRLGVAQQTVSDWLMPNTDAGKAHNDNRVKVAKEEQAGILERAEAGELQAQIAADFGISQPRVSRIVKAEQKRRKREDELKAQREAIARGEIDLDKGPHDVIVIDPPWPYGTEYSPEGRRSASPYPEMPLEEIAALNVNPATDCILWLWTTHKFMRHALPLLDIWGFEEKVILTWVKDKIGTGSWLRSQSEFCIMAVRGQPKINLTNQSTVLYGPLREHSRKPEEFYKMVEELCPAPRRIDWFSRERRPGWGQGGNDTNRFGSAA